jgi:hypothetical protein
VSADNYISVGRDWAGKFEVRYGFASDESPGRLVSEHDDLASALIAAHEYNRKVGYVEYGVTVDESAAVH